MAEEFLSLDDAFLTGSGIHSSFESPDLETFCQTFDRDYSYKFDENEVLEFTPESIFDQIIEGNCSFSSSSDDDGTRWDLSDHKQGMFMGTIIKNENDDHDVNHINFQKDYSSFSMHNENLNLTNNTSPINSNGSMETDPKTALNGFKKEVETPHRIVIGENTSSEPKLISLGAGSILCHSFNNVKIVGNVSPERKTVPIISKHVTPDKAKSRDRSANYEISLYKKQQRMIRNRESAFLSRKRKREYVSSLEQQIKDLKKENDLLKQENSNLRSKMAMQEVVPDMKFDVWKKCKKVTAILAVVLMISFNIPTFLNDDGIIEDNMIRIEKESDVFHKRSLLWTNDGIISDSENTVTTWNTSPLNNSTFAHLKCPMYINQTESMRLDSELRRWIGIDESSNNEKNHTKKMKQSRLNDIDIQRPLVITEKRKRLFFHHIENSKFGQMYKLDDGDLFESTNDALYQAMHRKLDTFYVVSFSQDHLLLPALNNNRTLIPKMSLLLPSLPSSSHVNNTDSMVSMTQIDCAVTDIRLIQMKEKDIPLHLRSHLNNKQSATNNDTFINTNEVKKKSYNRFSSNKL